MSEVDWPALWEAYRASAAPPAGVAEIPRCTATSKQSGQQCKRRPTPGARVCYYHGGASPQVRQAAAERVAAQQAVRLAEQLDIDVSKFDGDPRRALRESLIIAQSWAARFGTLLGRLDDASLRYAGRISEQRRAEFDMAVSALDRVTAIATALARVEGRAGDNEAIREAAEAAGRAAMARTHSQLIAFVRSAVYSAANGDNERAAKALDELDARVAARTGSKGGLDGAAGG